ncbi:MAG TPA: putative nucleotide-diphospho-sugar transferase [Candidatus Acidoferrum sp.]|nr:putative nucleotide-diphospho-sugar transferase [Candidatus Acidoferrum sp.]
MTTIPHSGLLQRSRTTLGRLRRNWQAALSVQHGRQLAETGRHDAALAAFRRAFDLNPSTPLHVYEALGVSGADSIAQAREAETLQLAGNEQEANRLYAQAIAHAGNYRESNDLDRLLQQAVTDDHVVITQFAINYFPMFEIWHRYFTRCDGRNLLVIALDPVVYRKVRDMGVPAYLLPVFNFQADIRSILWYETVRFRQRLIERGVGYLHSDIDAFWMQNPVAEVTRHPTDIVASIGYGTPAYVVDAWGFVLCLGFYLMRSTANTRKLYPAYVKYTRDCGHDQNGLNTLLLERGTRWRQSAGADDGVWHGKCESLGLELTVVPDTLITRQEKIYESSIKPMVVHPQLEMKSMVGKLQALAAMGIA